MKLFDLLRVKENRLNGCGFEADFLPLLLDFGNPLPTELELRPSVCAVTDVPVPVDRRNGQCTRTRRVHVGLVLETVPITPVIFVKLEQKTGTDVGHAIVVDGADVAGNELLAKTRR